MTVFTQRPDSTTGYDTYLKSTANKASETKLSIGRTYTPQETIETTKIVGYDTYYTVQSKLDGSRRDYLKSWFLAQTADFRFRFIVIKQFDKPIYETTTTVIPASNNIYTSLLKFDLSSLVGTTVNSATLILLYSRSSCSTSPYSKA